MSVTYSYDAGTDTYTDIQVTSNINQSIIASRFNQVQLVDGQQRLTTLFLLLWALKYTYSEDLSVSEIDKLLFNSALVQRNHGEKYRLKLKPLVGDNNVYQKIANGTEKKEFKKKFKNHQ